MFAARLLVWFSSIVWLATAGCSSAGDCSGHTPGTLLCDGTPCRIERCRAPVDAGAFPPIVGGSICLPDGGSLPGASTVANECDGPEDCPAGQQCLQEEFGRACNTMSFDPSRGPACHADCDCPSGMHCQPGRDVSWCVSS